MTQPQTEAPSAAAPSPAAVVAPAVAPVVASEVAPVVVSVHHSGSHTVSKPTALEIRLLAGLGVEGDAHCGPTVRHRSARRRDPEAPNLRQVHLIGAELFADLGDLGFPVGPGDLGENVTTTGVDLLALPEGATVRLGDQAVVRLTGLRTPCRLVDGVQRGLMEQLWTRDATGRRRRRAGVMGVVVTGGVVRAGDPLSVVLPPTPHTALPPV
jgi:MOSC domain-containing protein YiiM